MSFEKGISHCERCGQVFFVNTGTSETVDEEEQESKQAGFCSSRCLYRQEAEDNSKVTKDML